MTDHPIAPPPLELVHQWADMLASRSDQAVFTMAVQYGADQELDKSNNWLVLNGYGEAASRLRAARRPKPPSLKESALNALEHILRHSQTDHGANTIRRALEALDD